MTVSTQEDLARYAAADEPYVIRVADAIDIAPFGAEVEVTSDKTIVGVGTAGHLVHGGHKAFGTGWTENAVTQLTLHHNWFKGTKQRNPSADNCAYAHLYNNYLSGQVDDGDPVWTYGNWARGRTKMVLENSYFRGVQHPCQADDTAELVQRGSMLKDTTGRHDAWGEAFEPRDFYDYRLDPAEYVPALLREQSGPQESIGTDTASGTEGNEEPVTTELGPGTYRQKPRIGKEQHHITLVGTGADRSDTTVVFDTPSGEPKPGGGKQGSLGSATVVVEGDDFTARNVIFANDFDEDAHEIDGEQAHLGRPWHPSGDPDAIAQVLIRETEPPAAIKASPWTDMGGFSWRDVRFSEYRNTGPGAAVTPDRPQLTDEQSAQHDVADYLSGADGWAPHSTS